MHEEILVGQNRAPVDIVDVPSFTVCDYMLYSISLFLNENSTAGGTEVGRF